MSDRGKEQEEKQALLGELDDLIGLLDNEIEAATPAEERSAKPATTTPAAKRPQPAAPFPTKAKSAAPRVSPINPDDIPVLEEVVSEQTTPAPQRYSRKQLEALVEVMVEREVAKLRDELKQRLMNELTAILSRRK